VTDDGLARPRRGWVVPILLSVAALGVSIYLTIDHYASAEVLVCSVDGPVDCERVTTSAQSMVFGVPVAVLGVAWSAVMIVLSLPRLWYSGSWLIWTARQAMVWGGMAFVAWLVYAELFLIGAICSWCTVVHVIAVALFIVVLRYAPRPAGRPA
jgi:uncharacterized membrane protein